MSFNKCVNCDSFEKRKNPVGAGLLQNVLSSELRGIYHDLILNWIKTRELHDTLLHGVIMRSYHQYISRSEKIQVFLSMSNSIFVGCHV